MSKLIYVERDGEGRIVATYANPQPGFAEEELTPDHPGLATGAPAWGAIRQERNRLLAACDWTQLPDSPLGDLKKTEWIAYRRMLRAIPAAAETPADITWPEPPQTEGFP